MDVINQDTKDTLKQIVHKIENLERDKTAITDDLKEVYLEAKSAGFDTKILKTVVKLRRMNKQDLDEQEELIETYKIALDMI